MSDTLEQVVSDGICFLQSLTEHYGADRGMEMWEEMTNVLGREVKGKVFFAMITGRSSTRVKFSIPVQTNGNYNPNAISVIKAIRTASGCSLKEAKDLYDKSLTEVVACECSSVSASRVFRAELVNLGCRII